MPNGLARISVWGYRLVSGPGSLHKHDDPLHCEANKRLKLFKSAWPTLPLFSTKCVGLGFPITPFQQRPQQVLAGLCVAMASRPLASWHG